MRYRNQHHHRVGASGDVSRFGWGGLLLSAAIACVGFVVAGCGSGMISPAAQPDPAQANARNVRYTLTDLGEVGESFNAPGQPLIISNSGWISGAADVGPDESGVDNALPTTNFVEHAVLWRGGKMVDIGNPGLGGNSFAYGVNDSGRASGEAETTAGGLSTTEDFCGFQQMGFTTAPTPCVPFFWNGSHMVPLPTLGGVNGVANEINNNGTVVGYAENTALDSNCAAPQKYEFKPVAWVSGKIQQLPTVGGDMEGVAYSINDLGQVVGTTGGCGPFSFISLYYLNPVHAVLWQDGKAVDLGNLGGQFNNIAHRINNLGEVVGGSDITGDQTSHAFLWTPDTQKMQDLGTVGTDVYSFALGINDAGEITGISVNQDFSVVRAFIRRNGALVDLNTLLSGNINDNDGNPLFLATACSITSSGKIIGIAIDSVTGETHAYLASPVHGESAAGASIVKPAVLPEAVRARFRLAAHLGR